MNKVFLPLCAALAALVCSNCQQQQYKAYFLTESSTPEGGGAFNVRYNGRMYNRMPIMSLRHFEKFRSFLADDGSYGVVLYTSKKYRTRLFTETHQNMGKMMLPVIDGLAFTPLELDQGITDGQIVIWNGLNGYDLRRISETLDPITPEIEEKRYLDDNPRPKPELPKNAKPVKDEHGRLIPELYSSASDAPHAVKEEEETVPELFTTRSKKKP